MTTKHTPSPWRYEPGRDSRPPYVIRGSEGGFVVVGMTADRQEADAALIAAAPELLKEAESAVRRIDWFLDANPDHVDSTLNVIRQDLRAAIAKAKGEQQ